MDHRHLWQSDRDHAAIAGQHAEGLGLQQITVGNLRKPNSRAVHVAMHEQR